MNKHIKIIIAQVIFLAIISSAVYLIYPKTNVEVDGTIVNFKSINANVVVISENPDFSNPYYLDMTRRKIISFDLEPGTYYWKASNNYIEGLKKELKIESEIGMEIKRGGEGEARLENIGNVKINITKSDDGIMVGHIILSPDDEEEIEDKGEYTGRQNE